MSSKRRLRRNKERKIERSCTNKKSYPSELLTNKAVYHIRKKQEGKIHKVKLGFLHAYKCKVCSKWHIGNGKYKESMNKYIDQMKGDTK